MLLLSLALGLQAQVFHDPREVPNALRQPPKLSVGLDSRRSFISARDVKVIGLRASMDFDHRARIGFGVYFLASPFFRTFIRPDLQGELDTLQGRLEFTYMSAFFEYVILSTKRWECSLPIHIGIGDVAFRGIPDPAQTVLLSETTLLASYKIFPFIGLGGGIGYRQILAGGELLRENFNSPTYSFGLKFWLGYLYDKLIKRKPA